MVAPWVPCMGYEEQVGSVKRNVPFFWKPNVDVPLTELQKLIHLQMSTQGAITLIKHFSYQDKHHRTVRLSRADIERNFSHTRCSYVSNTSRTEIGRIMSIFKHMLGVNHTVCSYVLV